MDAKYKNPDNDVMPWTSDNPCAPGAATHQGMVYAIQHPFTGKLLYPSDGACWRYQQDQMLEYMSGWCDYELRDIEDAEQRAHICGVSAADVREGVQAIMLVNPLEESRQTALAVYNRGQWPRFYFTKGGMGGIRRKTYLENLGGRLATNYWPYEEVGHTDEAKKELKAIFGGKSPFDTPKPTRLIERVLQVAAGKDALVLDSFAGSGTTAHACLRLNQADGGARRFILCEMMSYADDTTAERVRRVIAGYGEGNRTVAGTGGGFSYFELGPALFDGDGNLDGSVTRAELMRYVWYTETKAPFEDRIAESPYLMGTAGDAAYYLAWEPGSEAVLDYDLLGVLPVRGRPTVVYADRCALAPATLDELGVRFKQVPRQIARM